MADKFATLSQTAQTPSENPYAVTPDDDDALPAVPKFLYVGTGGAVVLRGLDSAADVTFENVPNGGYLFVRAEFVRATGTTASDIIACA